MPQWKFETLDPAYGKVSEGNAWDGSGMLYTRIQHSRIMRYDPAAGTVSVWRENTNYSNGLTFDAQGRLYACQGGASPDLRRVVRFEADGSVTVLADSFEGKRLNIPNDLVADPEGCLWFTDPFYENSAGPWSQDRTCKELPHDSVYRLDPRPDGSYAITRVTFETTRPNGLLFSLDYKTLYVAQSGREPSEKRQLWAYPVKGDKSLGSPEMLHDFGAHRGIDGMRLDTAGNIIACCGWEVSGPGPRICVFSPSGEVLETHPVPCTRPTNCAFGGDDLSTLYVTTIEGYLFRAQTERVGRPLYSGRV
ncbi:MAG: SMP-30/gluconolactonase/LRE family protein [Acidobacteriota bacterium]